MASQSWVDLGALRVPTGQLEGPVPWELRPWVPSPHLQVGKRRCKAALAWEELCWVGPWSIPEAPGATALPDSHPDSDQTWGRAACLGF